MTEMNKYTKTTPTAVSGDGRNAPAAVSTNKDFTVEIEYGRIMFMTSYRNEFGEKCQVANIISKERLIEIRDNINIALSKLPEPITQDQILAQSEIAELGFARTALSKINPCLF